MNKAQYLATMGITSWVERGKAGVAPERAVDWPSLRQQALACQACTLCEARTQVVFGTGNEQAQLLIVGDAPTEGEDSQGEPFIGPAGELLTKMLRAIGLSREQVYLANAIKCHPPSNRSPKPEEVAACTPWLQQQIELLQPEVILAVGQFGAQCLLGSNDSLSAMRGQEYHYQDIPLLVSHHPTQLLQTPDKKREAWEDLQRLKNYLP
jgi:DNA polymerase